MAYRDKQKQKEYAAKHYSKNKDKMKLKASINNDEARIRNKKYVLEYLITHPCVDCGNNNPIVLEFDHVRGEKFRNISEMSLRAYSLKTIQEEISKCEVRCANCHRIATHDRRVSRSIRTPDLLIMSQVL